MDRKEKLKKFIEKYSDTYSMHNPNILSNVIQFLQTLLEFSFTIDQYEQIPKIFLGDENDEIDNNQTREYTQPIIFINLLKRAYAPMNDTNNKLFNNTEVILASTPTLYKSQVKIYNDENGEEQKIIYKTGIFRSDNEVLLTLKTKTLFEQYLIINTLEKTFNIYAKSFHNKYIQASGISKIECESTKDKDSLQTAKIYMQFRLNELVDFNDTYLLKAFNIYAGFDSDETIYIDGSENNFKQPDKVDKFPKNNKENDEKQLFF